MTELKSSEGTYFDSERREFIRVRTQLDIRYKLISLTSKHCDGAIYEGVSQNLGGGGLLLVGRIPSGEVVLDLLLQRIAIGINLFLSAGEPPVKALTRVAWVEAPPDGGERCRIGLQFKEITKEDQDRILRFIIKAQLPG